MAVALLAVAASAARTLFGGQDLNFDLITYHFYLGFAAFQDRLALDFLPAGLLSYLSPLPYVPLFLLDRAGVPPAANAVLHAGFHALALVVLFPLTRILLRGTALEDSRTACAALWLLGAVAPVYWQVVGTSFADPLTATLVLGALWLVAGGLPRHDRREALGLLAAGAAIAGATVAMRPHNAILVVAMGCALLVAGPPGVRRLRMQAVFAAAAAAGWLLCFAPHAWQVHREFGSPLFPLFNGWLAAPEFPQANLPLVGFAPATIGEALALPFRMATYGEWVHGEKPYPDVRPALLVLSALGCLLLWAYRRLVPRAGAPRPLSPAPARRFVLAFFLVGALLWLTTSANMRYGLPLLLLVGPVCGALLQRLLPLRHVLLAVAIAALWQGLQHHVFFKQYRWPSAQWTSRYFDWDVPEPHAREPATYLSFGYKTASSLAPRLHPASRHANLVGAYSAGPDHPSAERIRRLIERSPRLYGVFDFYYTQQDEPGARSIKTYFRDHLRIWGLDFTDEPCRLVGLRPPDRQWQQFNRALGVSLRAAPPQFIFCELRAALPRHHEEAMRGWRRFQARLASLAQACPRLLHGAISAVRVPGRWLVSSFASSEFRLEFDDAGPFQLQLLRPPYSAATLGRLTDSGALLDGPCDGAIPTAAH